MGPREKSQYTMGETVLDVNQQIACKVKYRKENVGKPVSPLHAWGLLTFALGWMSTHRVYVPTSKEEPKPL